MLLKNKGFMFSIIFALSSIGSCRVMGTEDLIPLKQDVSTTTRGDTTKTTKSQHFVGRDVTLKLDADDRVTDGDALFFAEYVACFLAQDFKQVCNKSFPMGVTTIVNKTGQRYLLTIRIPLDEATSSDFDKYIDKFSKNTGEYRNKLAECIKDWKIDKDNIFRSIDDSLEIQKTCLSDGFCLNSGLVKDVLDFDTVIKDLFLDFDPIFFGGPFFDLGTSLLSDISDSFQLKSLSQKDETDLIKPTGKKGLELQRDMLDLYRQNTPEVLKEVLQKCFSKMKDTVDVSCYKNFSKSVEVKVNRN